MEQNISQIWFNSITRCFALNIMVMGMEGMERLEVIVVKGWAKF
jgi:hypothetical protein